MNSNRTTRDCPACMAREIKACMKNLTTTNAQLQEALKTAHSIEEFLYKAILPTKCLRDDNLLTVPDYDFKRFPPDSSIKTDRSALIKQIETVLLNDIPVAMAICIAYPVKGKCPVDANDNSWGHSVTLTGIKEVCNRQKSECHKMVKVQNSLGERWQKDHNDGWVDIDELAEASMAQTKVNQLAWIQKPGSKLEAKSLNKKQEIYQPSANKPFNPSLDKDVPDAYEGYHGVWKCLGGTYQENYREGCVPLKP